MPSLLVRQFIPDRPVSPTFGRQLFAVIQRCYGRARRRSTSAQLSTAQQSPPSGQPAPATDPQSLAAIEGATFGQNQLPLPNTTLTLRPLPTPLPANPGSGQPPPPPPVPFEATSDTEGKFSFQGIQPGRYALTAQHGGYRSRER